MPTDDLWRCSVCRAERVFSRPDCGDDHTGECPDWACSECGTAYLISPVVTGGRELAASGARTA